MAIEVMIARSAVSFLPHEAKMINIGKADAEYLHDPMTVPVIGLNRSIIMANIQYEKGMRL